MTNTSSTKKESLLRTLAVAGLVAIIILIAWLSVQIVRVAPSAFSSLASLAEGLVRYEKTESPAPTLTVTGPTGTLVAGETATLSWDETDNTTYTFSYECVPGTAVAVVSELGSKDLGCDERYDLGEASTLELAIVTDTPETTVTYTVLAFAATERDAIATATGTIMVMSPTEPALVAGATTTATSSIVEETGETSTTPPTTPATPPAVPQITFALPVSDPNGFVDLAIRYIGVGTTEAGLTSTLEKDSSGVLFFEVRNNGTKTSDSWSFTAALPDGSTYRSLNQPGLKPNERATLALTVETDGDSSHTFRVEVETDEDRNQDNNDFSQRVTFR